YNTFHLQNTKNHTSQVKVTSSAKHSMFEPSIHQDITNELKTTKNHSTFIIAASKLERVSI
ncbi:hypothetical protein, partial [Heyndrickxia coagulans]|uniref:hypothetical protein n=1 Tax=Heyndrickxia coagulans TaxID=1398 RepID=UPI00214DD35C